MAIAGTSMFGIKNSSNETYKFAQQVSSTSNEFAGGKIRDDLINVWYLPVASQKHVEQRNGAEFADLLFMGDQKYG